MELSTQAVQVQLELTLQALVVAVLVWLATEVTHQST
jgi:hypothetical protein